MTDSIFIAGEQLGIIQSQLSEALRAPNARTRQRKTRRLVAILRDLGVIPQDAPWPLGCAEGINSLGHQGFWLIFEETRRVEAEGPQLAQKFMTTSLF